MYTYLAVAVGGIVGACARYAMTQLIQLSFGRGFPLATLCVNLLGTFALAFLFVETVDRVAMSPLLRTGILTGGLGAFTTFSTFMLETVTLYDDGETGKAVLYLALSIGLGIVAAFAGIIVSRQL